MSCEWRTWTFLSWFVCEAIFRAKILYIIESLASSFDTTRWCDWVYLGASVGDGVGRGERTDNESKRWWYHLCLRVVENSWISSNTLLGDFETTLDAIKNYKVEREVVHVEEDPLLKERNGLRYGKIVVNRSTTSYEVRRKPGIYWDVYVRWLIWMWYAGIS